MLNNPAACGSKIAKNCDKAESFADKRLIGVAWRGCFFITQNDETSVC